MRKPPLSIACLVYLLCCILSNRLHAQELSYARYDVRDGLAGSVVYQCVQDKEGFLWFATETGVSRFDGTHFVNFTTADGLPDNEVLRLFVDSKNRIWMRPFRNAICYYYKGKIYNQENDFTLKKIQLTNEMVDIAEDTEGNIFIADQISIFRVDGKSGVVSQVLKDPHTYIIRLGMRHNGKLGVVQNRDQPHPYIGNINIHDFSYFEERTKYDMSFAHRVLLSPNLEIFHRKDSLFFNDPASGRSIPLFTGNTFKSISPLNDSMLSLNSSNGTTFYNFKSGRLIRRCLEHENVNSVMTDREGNFWFMTNGRGIYRVGSFEFRNFTFSTANHPELSVYSINKKGNSIYAGTDKAIVWRIDTMMTKHTIYLWNKPVPGRVLSIVNYQNGLIFGTDHGLALLRNGKLQKSTPTAVKSVTLYKDKLLVSANNALSIIGNDFGFNDPLQFGRSTVAGLLNDSVYMGSTYGLSRVLGKHRLKFLGDEFPALRSRITALGTSADSTTLWVATNGNGLIGFSNNRITHTITQKNGLTSDICRALFVTDKYLWLGTDKGLNRIQITGDSCKVTNYTVEDGLLANIVNCVYVEGSQVYVGTQAGLTTFDANKISQNTTCQLRITGISTLDQAWHYDTTGFVLQPERNAIRFDYAGISYRSAGDITYRYRLTGLHDTWQTTRETYLSYPSLPSGDYELQIIATNKFGVDSDMINIPFQVQQFYWEKTWFRILALIIVGVLIWIFVQSRIRKIRKQNDEKMQINNRMSELEQMALKAQMNPHFIFNSLNSVQQYVLDKDILGANKFITEFSRLIRFTLDISSKTRISIDEEINYLMTYLELEKTKYEDKFTFSVYTEPGFDTYDWSIPPMILQPYVENSIRHGVRYRPDKLGHIKLSFKTNNRYLICEVEDNGVGRQKAGQYKSEMPIEYQSKGMTLTAKRIEMLNKSMDTPVLIDIEDLILNDKPAGTRVTLKFPLKEAGRTN